MVWAQSVEDDSYHDVFSCGHWRYQCPELYIRSTSMQAAAELIKQASALMLAGQLYEGVMTFDQFRDDSGQLLRFGIKLLQGPEGLAVAQILSDRYTDVTGEAFNEVFFYGVWQIFAPDEDNVLPWEYGKDPAFVSLQDIAPVVVH